MTTRRSLLAGAMLALAWGSAAFGQAADPLAAAGAYNDGIVKIMKARLDRAARIERFETLVRDAYDMAAITALAVGPKWAEASPGDRAAAIQALTHHSAIALARNFTNYDGERFDIDGNVITRGTSRIVRVTIVSKNSRDVLLYRLTAAGNGWKIVDVIAEGVSQLAVQRAEFARNVAAGGVPELTRRLREADAVKTGER